MDKDKDERKYIDLDKINQDTQKVIDFIFEELEVDHFDDSIALLDNVENALRSSVENSENDARDFEKPDNSNPDYIG